MPSFGKDTSCTTELRTGRYASGVRLVAEALFRRYITPRGMLRGDDEEANYGFDVAARVGRVVSPGDVEALKDEMRSEALKDERIDRVSIYVTETKIGADISYAIGVDAETGEGPFSLNISVTDLTVELLGITVAA